MTKLQILVWVFIIALWGLFTVIFIFIALHQEDALFDYIAYYNAAQRLNDGLPIYTSINASKTYLYPPLLAQAIAPLEATISFIETATVWIIFNIICLLVATIFMALQIKKSWKHYLIWLMPLIFLPILETYTYGQLVPIMLLLLISTMIAYKNGYPMLAGGLLAIATWLKIYPIYIIAYFLLHREWRIVISAFVVGITLLLLQIGISGIELIEIYFTDTLVNLATHGQSFNIFRNHSIFGFTHRLFVDNQTIAKLLQWGIAGGMLITMLFTSQLSWKKNLRDLSPEEFDLEYGMLIVFMLLMGSTLFSTSMLPIILPIAIALKYAKGLKQHLILLISFMLMEFTLGFISAKESLYLHPLIQGYGFYAIFILWGLLVYLRWKKIRSLAK